MANSIRSISVICDRGNHSKCKNDGERYCYCECHKPEDERSVRWKLEQLAQSTMPASQRLQVLIQLMIEKENR